jgi:DNA modification methylase
MILERLFKLTSTVLQGDNRDVLKQFPANHFDSIITDPPYGIDFLGKEWDANTGALATYEECLRVLKPGGHILAFSAARTYHHLAVTIESAGFEIRDQIMWIYSSGFPKSQQVKTHPGWGTCLKPAHEPIVLARKPIKTSIKNNMEIYNVGGLNIDATRVPYESEQDKNSIDHKRPTKAWSGHTIQTGSYEQDAFVKVETNELGRFPSNVLGEIKDYQKYFYCPKVGRKERHIGFDDANSTKSMLDDMGASYIDDKGNPVPYEERNNKPQIYIPGVGTIYTHGLKDEYAKWCIKNNKINLEGNNHPTVKPIELMKYLIKLVTPKGGHVLDPFNGSGSTGCAAVELNYVYTGIELDPKYVEIARKRIQAWYEHTHNNIFSELFEIDA